MVPIRHRQMCCCLTPCVISLLLVLAVIIVVDIITSTRITDRIIEACIFILGKHTHLCVARSQNLEGTKGTLGKGAVRKIGVRYVSLCFKPHCFRPFAKRPFAKRPFGPLRGMFNARALRVPVFEIGRIRLETSSDSCGSKRYYRLRFTGICVKQEGGTDSSNSRDFEQYCFNSVLAIFYPPLK